MPPPASTIPPPDPYCTNSKTVAKGQTCESIADKRCTVPLSTFRSRNPHLNCNGNPTEGQIFCCNEGRVPPANYCTNVKTVADKDTCPSMADKRCTISIAKFVEYNPHLSCQDETKLFIGERFCCNEGRVPPPGPPPDRKSTRLNSSHWE